MPVILAVGRLGQEDYQKFETTLGYIVQGSLGYKVFVVIAGKTVNIKFFVDVLQFVTTETF